MSPDVLQSAQTISILLVDDHPAVREGLRLLLEQEGIVVCGTASRYPEAIASLKTCEPDLALVDLSLCGEDELELVKDLRARRVPSLVYSMHDDLRHVEAALSAGALGYITKREVHQILVHGIREVAAGRRFVSPGAALALAEHLTGSQPRGADRGLSDQEKQVYGLIGQGEGTIEIAAALHISTRTVESYYARILGKLGLSGMRDLRRHAISHSRGRMP